MGGWSSFRDSIVKPALGAAAGFVVSGGNLAVAAKGASMVSGLESARQDGNDASDFANTAASQRQAAYDAQAAAAASQQAGFDAKSEYLAGEQERYDSLYAPIEEGIAAELAAGPNTVEAAAIAGNTFASQFDSEIASRERTQQQQGVNYRAGSSAERMQGENDAYSRAMGIASSQTTARREEEDQHFLNSTAFYNANGSGIKTQLLNGMQEMYGSDYDAYNNTATQQAENAAVTQGYSSALNTQANSTISSVVDAGTQLYKSGALSGITDTLGGLFSDDSDAVGVTQNAGVQSTGVTTSATSNPQAIKLPTPNANSYANTGALTQTQAAIAGNTQSYYNRNS